MLLTGGGAEDRTQLCSVNVLLPVDDLAVLEVPDVGDLCIEGEPCRLARPFVPGFGQDRVAQSNEAIEVDGEAVIVLWDARKDVLNDLLGTHNIGGIVPVGIALGFVPLDALIEVG